MGMVKKEPLVKLMLRLHPFGHLPSYRLKTLWRQTLYDPQPTLSAPRNFGNFLEILLQGSH